MNNIAILDLDSIAFAIGNGNKILDSDGNPMRTEDGKRFLYTEKTEDELAASCKFIMQDILLSSKAKEYVGFIKGLDTIKSKRLINPDYKADRKLQSPGWWIFVKSYLLGNYNVYTADYHEVDDYVRMYNLACPNSFICAIDSDLLSLEGEHFNWRKKEWITTTKEEANYVFWQNMITGTHNATKGIPRKGEAYVKKAFAEAEELGEFLDVTVFREFTNHFGIDEGIKQFYSNYICTKILEKSDNFDLTSYPAKNVMTIF